MKLRGTDTEVVAKAKLYYAACMNMTAADLRGIGPLMKVGRN